MATIYGKERKRKINEKLAAGGLPTSLSGTFIKRVPHKRLELIESFEKKMKYNEKQFSLNEDPTDKEISRYNSIQSGLQSLIDAERKTLNMQVKSAEKFNISSAVTMRKTTTDLKTKASVANNPKRKIK